MTPQDSNTTRERSISPSQWRALGKLAGARENAAGSGAGEMFAPAWLIEEAESTLLVLVRKGLATSRLQYEDVTNRPYNEYIITAKGIERWAKRNQKPTT